VSRAPIPRICTRKPNPRVSTSLGCCFITHFCTSESAWLRHSTERFVGIRYPTELTVDFGEPFLSAAGGQPLPRGYAIASQKRLRLHSHDSSSANTLQSTPGSGGGTRRRRRRRRAFIAKGGPEEERISLIENPHIQLLPAPSLPSFPLGLSVFPLLHSTRQSGER
jgi:hypothetical protein